MTTTKFTDAEREDLPSASSAPRRQACLGSPDTGSSPSSALADEGTLIHKALETGDYSELTEEQVQIGERIQDMMDTAYGKWVDRITRDGQKLDGMKEFKETRFWIIKPGTKVKMESAKLDLCYVCGTKAIIIDSKTGFKDAMPSPRNIQLRFQALALWHYYPELTEITVAIAQVRFKSNYNECVYSAHDMQMAKQQFLLLHWMRSQPDAPRSAGTHCQYCPALDDCKTAAGYALVTPSSLALTPQSSKQDAIEVVNGLSDSALAQLHAYSTVTNNVFEAAKARLKSFDEARRQAVGLTMGKPSKVATITDIPGAGSILIENLKVVTEQEFNAAIKLAVGPIEKIAVPRLAKREDINQKVAKEKLRAALANCITYAEKSASLEPYVPEEKQINE